MKKIALLSLVFLLGLSYSFGQIVSGNCYQLTISGVGTLTGTAGATPTVVATTGATNQIWKLTSGGGNSYSILNMATNTYLNYPSSPGYCSLSANVQYWNLSFYNGGPTYLLSVSSPASSFTLYGGSPYLAGTISGTANFGFTLTQQTCPGVTPPTTTDSFWETSTVGTGNIRAKSTVNGVIIGTGITSAPAGYKLYVEGGVLAEKVRVTPKNGANWADYVFEKGYKLPTLEKVENYITKNGHLEGIPTTIEVKEQGVDLLEMNAKLLEKVEQLTLYVIQQQKEIKILKKRK